MYIENLVKISYYIYLGFLLHILLSRCAFFSHSMIHRLLLKQQVHLLRLQIAITSTCRIMMIIILLIDQHLLLLLLLL